MPGQIGWRTIRIGHLGRQTGHSNVGQIAQTPLFQRFVVQLLFANVSIRFEKVFDASEGNKNGLLEHIEWSLVRFTR